ncbi:phosphotransferase [Ruegeria lacuscaerulensis]|uniref:phosphotransferase n=1 Tax=Ruegeria lacuscaerulensis TaxID=55218 RepID=UPI00147FDDC6|nr:phosphotransferase [Ruegeria lacuscaerulensis]
MHPLSDAEFHRASRYVDEFARQIGANPVGAFDCTYRSHDFPDTRMVIKLRAAHEVYALKIDIDSPDTGRLKQEFDHLTALSEYFSPMKDSDVVHPVYLSPSQAFFVTPFIDRPTAADLIHNSIDDTQVAQIYRRAGAWLNDLHSFRPSKEYRFRPKWMTDLIAELNAQVPPSVRAESDVMLRVLLAEMAGLRGAPETQVLAHGDFHSQNLIVGQGQMVGLDFTETREKLAVYDIVDFLKSDVFRNAPTDAIDRSGIVQANKQMFLRRYRHPFRMDVLDFCLRARLLIDWLSLWQADHPYSAYDEDRRKRLGDRLRPAFQKP